MGLEGSAFEALERDFQEVLQVCMGSIFLFVVQWQILMHALSQAWQHRDLLHPPNPQLMVPL
jgi:hypothetical protein